MTRQNQTMLYLPSYYQYIQMKTRRPIPIPPTLSTARRMRESSYEGAMLVGKIIKIIILVSYIFHPFQLSTVISIIITHTHTYIYIQSLSVFLSKPISQTESKFKYMKTKCVFQLQQSFNA